MLQALTALPRPEQQRPDQPESAMSAVHRRVWTIPARAREFTGRAALLAELETPQRAGEPAVVQALIGIGGTGKTTAAVEYAHRHYDEFDIAWWVPAENLALLPERLAELALALDLTTATTPPGWVRLDFWANWGAEIAGYWYSTTLKTPAPCPSGYRRDPAE